MPKEEVIAYLKTLSVILISFLSFIFPLFFLTNTTEFFIFPKQLLVVFVAGTLLVVWGVRMIYERRVTIRSTPFNIPLLLFGAVVLISSLLSINRADSLMQSLPLLALLVFYFVTVNTLDEQSSYNIALSSFTLGAVVSALIPILYYYKIYFLPFPIIQTQYFNTAGSLIHQIAYLIPPLAASAFYLARRPNLKNMFSNESLIHSVSSILLLAGIALVVYQIAVIPQKPVILPYVHGFQIAFAALSQGASRLFLSFLVGSGYGTFATDFTRFRLPSFNLEQNIWNLTFFYSSSYVLELIATTGLLGIASYLFVLYTFVKSRTRAVNPIFVGVALSFVMSFVIPFSYVLVFELVALLAFYTGYLYLARARRVYDIRFSLVALREGLISVESEGHYGEHPRRSQEESVALPIGFLLVTALFAGFVVFLGARLFISDMKFAQSLQPEALNNGQKAYNLENEALATFPYKSDYYRVFSQLNLALANSLLNSVPRNSSPSAQTQQTVLALLQQSVNTARRGTDLARLSSLNWVNLSQIYRSLINVGQGAEQFSIDSLRQAILLDPTNPQLYIELGGIYYQLGQYDAAENQFRSAVSLKPDFANAYYNLGHALEQKNNLQAALTAYQAVAQLVRNDKQSLKKITAEIDALQKRIGETAQKEQKISGQAQNQPPLELNAPGTTVPSQVQPVKLPPPGKAPVASPTETPPSPTPSK